MMSGMPCSSVDAHWLNDWPKTRPVVGAEVDDVDGWDIILLSCFKVLEASDLTCCRKLDGRIWTWKRNKGENKNVPPPFTFPPEMIAEIARALAATGEWYHTHLDTFTFEIDKKTRVRATQQLQTCLDREWNELEMLKLWKGIFYCMWMADMRPYQQELARYIASCMEACSQSSASLFYGAFWTTVSREWHGIDVLRSVH